MDVRCEKCLTVYELDDARVVSGGLTVKCQECGNLFKVRRRPETAELVASGSSSATPSSAATSTPAPAHPQLVSDPNLDSQPTTMTRTEETTAASSRARRVLGADDAVPEPIGLESEGHDTEPSEAPREVGWMVRSAKTRDVQRFRELTTLQQWIVERRVSREDEISRGGESWKPLGGIAELASFFHVVEQAESVARATQPGLAVRRANQMGSLDRDQLAQLPTDVQRSLPSRPMTFAEDGEDSATTLQAPSQKKKGRTAAWVGLALAIGGTAAGSWLYMQRRHDGTTPSEPSAAEVRAAVDKGRADRLADTEDGFRQAIAALEPISMGPDVEPKVELVEAHVTWSTHLLEDAKSKEATDPTASRTMASEAQAQLERAHRVLDAAKVDDPRLALVRADLLRVEGQPTDAVERELTKARAAQTDSALLDQVEGELALRDGKLDDARSKLTHAATPHAQHRLAQLAAKVVTDLGTTAPADLATVVAANPDTATKPETAAKPDTKPEVPAGDYKALVKEGDHLAESGRTREAQKKYERALELDPKGVQALVGLGYCNLDAEKFMQAVDRFNAALEIDPGAGDALVGLAESYRIRGRSAQAAELYKKYLAAHPTGDRAAMAKKALQQLDQSPPKSESTPLLDRVTVKPQDDKPADKPVEKSEKPDKPDKSTEETPLPRLPEQSQ